MLVQCTHNVILVIQIDGRLFAMDPNISKYELVSVFVCAACAPTICCIKTSFSTWQHAFIKLLHQETQPSDALCSCRFDDVQCYFFFSLFNRINIFHSSWWTRAYIVWSIIVFPCGLNIFLLSLSVSQPDNLVAKYALVKRDFICVCKCFHRKRNVVYAYHTYTKAAVQ